MSYCRCGCGGYNCCVSTCNPCGSTTSNLYPTTGVAVVQNSWNVPACGSNATLNIPGLKSALVGGNLWNPTYGYFEITSFDAVLGQMVVKNNCLQGNASPGTVVPAYTPFVLIDRIADDFYNLWTSFATEFAALTSSGAAPTGVTVTAAQYKVTDYDLVDFYAEISEFTIVGTPQYIYAPLPVPAYNTIYQGNFWLYMEDSGGALETAYVDIYPDTSTLRFHATHGATAFAAGAGAVIRVNVRYRKA